MILQNYSLMKVPMFIKGAVDELEKGDERNFDLLLTYVFSSFGFVMLACFSMFMMRRYIISVSRWVEYEIRKKLFNHLMKLDYGFYQENQTGDLISRCTNDLDNVRTLVGPGIMYIPNSLSRMAFFLPVMLGISTTLVMIELAIVTVIIVLLVTLMPKLRPYYRAIQEQLGEINSRAWQFISGINTIRLYGSEKNEETRFSGMNEEYVKRNMAIAKIRGVLWPSLIYTFVLSQFFILLFGGKEVIEGAMGKGDLLAFFMLVSELTFPVLSFGWVMTLIQQGVAAMERLNKIMDHPVEKVGEEKKLNDDAFIFAMKDVKASYPGSEHFEIHIKELKIKRGEMLGITGPVGGGKTTLVNLLSGVLRTEEGEILFKGVPVNEINRSQLYAEVGLVPQEAFLFSKTVSENIGLTELDHINQPRVEEASQEASLKDEIIRFNKGYEEVVGERGLTLSGGQKQRATMARAFYGELDILLLDDSLSAVDAEVEKKILDFLKEHKHDKTLIIASNRVSALRLTDRILVVDEGKIIQDGKHETLLSQEGAYKKLADLQQMEASLTGASD